VGLSEVPRSLEKVYLQAINSVEGDDQKLERAEHASDEETQHVG
jgi:hypothetical protein